MPSENVSDVTEMTLEELRSHELHLQVPVVVYLLLISITGIFGNSLVFYVYKWKYSPSTCRTFVIYLSIMDLISCIVAIPVEVWFLFMEFDFQTAWICKASVFLNNWPTLTSGFLLVCIAIDRYRKVCQPFQWQISGKMAAFMCVLTALVALAFSWLSLVIYGIQTTQHPVYQNVTISQCVETDTMKETVFPMLNNAFFALLFLGSLSTIIIMYCLIALKVRRHMKKREYMVNKTSYPQDMTEASEMTIMSGKVVIENKLRNSVDDLETSEDIFYSTDTLNSKDLVSKSETYTPVMCSIDNSDEPSNTSRHSVLSRMFSRLTSSSVTSKSTISGRSNGTHKHRHRKSKSKQQKANRTAFIMFQISLAFILSYLPLLCLLLIRTINSTFVTSLNDGERAAYKFFLRSYYLNCAVNPVIYGLWDTRFRKACKKLLCRCKQ